MNTLTDGTVALALVVVTVLLGSAWMTTYALVKLVLTQRSFLDKRRDEDEPSRIHRVS